MTWLGKILAVLVLLMSLVWMWFTASAFAVRTNWKEQATMYKKAFDEARAAREGEYKVYQAEKDALERQLAAEQSKSSGLVDRVADLEKSNKEYVASAAALDKAFQDADIKAVQLQANLQAEIDRANKLSARANELEDERVRLVIAKEQAEKNRQAAENQSRQAEAARLLAEQENERLVAQVNDLRTSGANPSATLLNNLDRPAAPVPEGLRGTVSAYRDGYVVISVGIDAGLTSGATLDLYREGEGGKYLGTVKVQRVYPKDAVAVFTPADPRRSVKQLRPDELPKAGDIVGKVGSVGAGR